MILWQSKSFNNNKFDSDYNITDKPVWVNACGIDFLDGLTDDYVIERPQGRKDYQLIYIKTGNPVFNLGGKKTRLSENTLILYRPYEPQYYIYPKNSKNVAYWIHFSGNEIDSLLSKFGYKFHCKKLNPNYYDFETAVNDMLKYIDNSNTNEICPALFRILIIKTVDYLNDSKSISPDNRLEAAKQAIEVTYNESHKVSYYASLAGYNERYFIRYFKLLYGYTPGQYIAKLRIDRAIHMLKDTTMSVSSISRAVGFEDSFYFSRIFKKQTSKTPTEFRKIKR